MRKMTITKFSLCTAVIFLYPILPQYIYIIGNVNIVNGMLAAFHLIYLLFFGKFTKIKLRESIFLYWLYLCIMFVFNFVDAGFFKAATYLMSFIMLPWMIISVVNTETRFIKVVDTLILAGTFIGVLGIIESIFKVNFIQPLASSEIEFFHEIRYGLLRIMTTFGQPIAYGLYQVFIVALINYRIRAFWGKKYLKISYIICVLNIFLSVSRIPIIAFVLLQILLLYRESKKKFANYLVLGSIGFLFAMIITTSIGLKIPLIDDLLETVNQLLAGNTEPSSGTVGFGNRFDLWLWVYLSMGNNWITGHGVTAEFAYKVYEWQTKTSIENQYLYVLWHNGLVGLSLLILSYLAILVYAFRRRGNYIKKSVEKLSFNMVIFSVMLVYYVVELGVQESDIARIYTVLIALLIAYNRIDKSNKKYRSIN